MNSVPMWLVTLLACPPLPKNIRLTGEERICIAFFLRVRGLIWEGRAKGVFHHIPNEGKRSWTAAKLLKAMGMVPGAGDYVFLWDDGKGYIEFKFEDGKQSEAQKSFQKWCELNKIPYVVCRSVEEGIETLKMWGVITDGKNH